jgi:hypothetical protein
MNGDPLAGDGLHGERFQPSRPGGTGLFWPSDRHLFRRRGAARLRALLGVALAVAVCALGYVLMLER